MAGQIAGKVALVTDATSAIGAATARLLTAEGAYVALVAPPPRPRLDALAAQIRDAGGQVLSLPTDLGTRTRALVRRVVEEWGHLGILVVANGYDATADGDRASVPSRLGRPHPAVRGLLHVAGLAGTPDRRRSTGLNASQVAAYQSVWDVPIRYAATLRDYQKIKSSH